MKYIIHGGKDEIGGNCIELFAKDGRIVLDMGIPLSADKAEDVPLPTVDGLLSKADDFYGVIVSHPHLDHYGLLYKVGEHVPVYMGKAAGRIIEAADPYMPFDKPKTIIGCLEHKESFKLGPFEVTPYLVDHSAYDSYALLIEADGSRLFYTGDLRGHGRKGKMMDRLLADPPIGIDNLIIEGTRLLPDGEVDTHENLSEYDVETKLNEEFSSTQGMVLVACSGQNIDRLVSIIKACRKTGRTLLIDLYTAVVLEATENPHIPVPGWNNIKVFVPFWQRVKIKNSGDFSLIKRMKKDRVYQEDLKSLAPKSVLAFRTSMIKDLERAECLDSASAVWSMWAGYLDEENLSGKRFIDFCSRNKIPWKVIHSSGHAPESLLRKLVERIDAKETVFVHTLRYSVNDSKETT